MNRSASLILPAPAAARDPLRFAAGAVFTALLVVAPLAFGATRAGGPELVAAGATAATLLWAASLAGLRQAPRVPTFVVAAVTLLVLAALPWLAGLVPATPVADFTASHFARVIARWPASVVWRTPANTLWLTLALGAATLALIDLARSRGWALTFALALTVTAAAVGLLAMAQNFTSAPGIYWRDDGRMPGNFNGVFFHHTAAGAYLNTAWPLALGLTVLAWRRARPVPRLDALTLAGALVTLVLLAAHGSHVSRFPQLAALLVLPFLVAGWQLRPRFTRARALFAAAGVAGLLLLVAASGRTPDIATRWQEFFALARADSAAPTRSAPVPESAWPALVRDDLFIAASSHPGVLGDRGEGWRTALRAIAARPWLGHGPANWIGAASHHTADPFVRTFFQFLQFTHQDFLQFAVEWGVPAAVAWWAVLAGALGAVLRARRAPRSVHRTLGVAAAGGLAAVLLQAQGDFPLQMPAIALNVTVLAALCWTAATPLPASAPSL